MVQFGRRLLALQYEPWESHYLDYTRLKSILEADNENEPPSQREREFVRELNIEIEKTVLFFLQEQGQLASRLSLLRQEEMECALHVRDLATQGSDSGLVTSIRNKLYGLSQGYTDVGEDLVNLVHFVELNLTGLRKILKKHDKVYKENKISDRYMSEQYIHADDSHLPQLLHFEGVGAIVATLKKSFAELRALNLIFQESEDYGGRHRRMHTAPEFALLPPSKEPLAKQHPTHLRTRTATVENLMQSLQSNESLYQEPILFKIDAARQRLRESSSFVNYLAASAMMERVSSEDDLKELEAEALPRHEVSRISSFLNLTSAFLYMTNYYIVAPTSGNYAAKLGGSQALAGIIIGMTPIAALLSTVLYSWWTSHSYKAALIFASACSVAGNAMYALGLPCDSLTLVMVGRLLNGFGSARSINRRYIADSYSRAERTAASAAFVSAGALGMAAGPALAALLDVITGNGVYWSAENAPGWVMFAAWCVYLVALMIFFRDPPKHVEPPRVKDIELTGERKALLSTVQEEVAETVTPPLWRNIPVMTTLVLYFVLKLALECCLSSTATLTSFYFGWGAQDSGVYLAVVGLLMFPANLLVAYFSRQYDDRELIMATLLILLVGVWGIVDYGNPAVYSLVQYIAFGVLIFISSNALEAPNMSLLSKTIPRSLAKGLFNVGLLATEAGTFGRAVGDVFITYCGLDGIEFLLNRIYVSLGVLVTLTVVGTYQVYPYLEPFDRDD